MKTIDIVVLALQVVLSCIFLYFGSLKLFLPIDKIAKRVSWAHDYAPSRIKFFGFLEVMGAVGIILPYQLDFFPILTPMAATGLAMVMAGSAVVHLKRDEIKMIFVNIFIIFLLAGIGFNTLLQIFHVDLG